MPEQKSRLTIFQIFSYSLFACNALFLYLGLFIFGYFLVTGRIAFNRAAALAGLLYIGMPLAWTGISAGLVEQRPWARISAIALAGFSLMSLLFICLVSSEFLAVSLAAWWPLFTFFIAVLLVMFMPSTKEQFGLTRKHF